MKNSLILDIKLCGYVEVKSSSPPPFPSLLYLSTFHRFSTFPFPLFPFHSYPTLPFSYLPLTLPFYFPSIVPYIPLSLSTVLLPSQPSFTFFRGYPSPFPLIFHLPFLPFFPFFIPLFFSLSQGGGKNFIHPCGISDCFKTQNNVFQLPSVQLSNP